MNSSNEWKMPRIGRGKNMSIAKAALLVYYNELLPEYRSAIRDPESMPYIYSGDLDTLHRIVTVAGARHCSFHTGHQVLSCLYSSSYWKSDYIVPGWNGKRANCYEPSEKGQQAYDEMLKRGQGRGG